MVKKTVLFLLLAVLQGIVLISCEGSNGFGPGNKGVISPLSVGNYWIFLDSTFSSGDTLVDTSKVGVSGRMNLLYENKNYEVFFWNWYDMETDEPQENKWLFKNGLDGLWNFGMMTTSDTSNLYKTLYLKYPVSVNDSWQVISNYDTLLYKCTGINKNFSTPAGNFLCYEYYYQRIDNRKKNYIDPFDDKNVFTDDFISKKERLADDIYLYYVPNIGYVGYIREENGVIKSKKVLLSYKIQ